MAIVTVHVTHRHLGHFSILNSIWNADGDWCSVQRGYHLVYVYAPLCFLSPLSLQLLCLDMKDKQEMKESCSHLMCVLINR